MIIRENEEPWPCDAPCDPPCDGWAHCDVTSAFSWLWVTICHNVCTAAWFVSPWYPLHAPTCWTGRAQTKIPWSQGLILCCGQTWPNYTSPTRKPVLVPEHSWMWCRWLDATPVRQFSDHLEWMKTLPPMWSNVQQRNATREWNCCRAPEAAVEPGELGSALDRPPGHWGSVEKTCEVRRTVRGSWQRWCQITSKEPVNNQCDPVWQSVIQNGHQSS